jgi:hypothetical protein
LVTDVDIDVGGLGDIDGLGCELLVSGFDVLCYGCDGLGLVFSTGGRAFGFV